MVISCRFSNRALLYFFLCVLLSLGLAPRAGAQTVLIGREVGGNDNSGHHIQPTPKTQQPVDAQIQWDNSHSSFNGASSWVGNKSPVAGDVAAFPAAAVIVQPSLSSSVIISGLYFKGAGASGYDITQSSSSSFTLTLTATGTSIGAETGDTSAVAIGAENTSGTNTIDVPVILAPTTGTNSTIFQQTGGTLRINGVISGSASLTKTGGGTLTLTGANTYSGGTNVNGGTLLVNNTTGSGTGSGSVIVNSTGTLGGTGTISGSVTVNSGGTLSPGSPASSPGILHTGALTLASGSTYLVNVNGGSGPTGTGAGTLYDQTVVTGTISLAGSLSLTLGATPLVAGDKFFIALNDGTDAVSGIFSNTTNGGMTYTQGFDVFSVNYADNGDGGSVGNDISLTLLAVPEPGTWLAAALGMTAVVISQRRRVAVLLRA